MARPTHLFDWTRFWVPYNKRIHVDEGGLLRDPTSDWGRYANRELRTTLQIIPEKGLTVLCGEPAMGKTFVLQQLAKQLKDVAAPGDEVWYLPFRDIPSDSAFSRLVLEAPRWKTWAAGTGRLTLLLDGVDEGRLKIPGFVGYLSQILSNQPLSRLRLILACRSMDWPVTEGLQLAAAWGPGEVNAVWRWELCPLREADVRLAATQRGLNDRTFLRAAKRKHLLGLTSRPLTLQMLLDEFEREGKIRSSHRELYRRTCLELCRDPDVERRDRVKQAEEPAKLLRIAERIAALVLVCNRASVVVDGTTSDSDLTVDQIANAEEVIEGGRFTVTPELVNQTLKTPLFWPAADGRVHFFHQTFAESLAASYLSRLPLAQLRPLLCSRDRYGEHVQPQLQQLACWIAAERADFFEHLREHDPETLLRADLSGISAARKEALLRAVLERAVSAKLFDARGETRFYHSLAFPGVERVLRPYLLRRTARDQAREIALDVAVACECRTLLPTLLKLLRDSGVADFHVSLAANLSAFLTAAEQPTVERLITGTKAHANRVVRIALTLALIRAGLWPLRKAVPLFPTLLSERSEGFGYSLVQYGVPADAVPLLDAIPTWTKPFDSLSGYHKFVELAYDLAVEQLEKPEVRKAFARVWHTAHRRHESFDGRRDHTLATVLADKPAARRALVRELATEPGLRAVDYHYITVLQQPEDFGWWLAEIPRLPAAEVPIIAALLSASYVYVRHADALELLLQRIADTPAIAAAFPWMRTWALDEPGAVQGRNQERETATQRAKMDARRRLDPAGPVWTKAMADAQDGTNSGWYQVAHNFFYTDKAKEPETVPWDLTTSPGWLAQPESVRADLRAIGRGFLIRQPGDPHLAKRGRSNHTEYAYRTLFLLKDEIRGDADLRAAVAASWLPVCFQDMWNNDAAQPVMTQLAEDLDPAAGERYLRDLLTRRARGKNHHLYELRVLTTVWKPRLSEVLADYLLARPRPGEMIESAFEFLEDVDAAAALVLVNRLLDSGHYTSGQEALLWSRAARLDLVATWPRLKTKLRLKNFAKQFAMATAVEHRDMQWPKGKAGAGKVLADLYRLLLKIFPPEKDPPSSTEGHVTSPRRQAGFFRGMALDALVTVGTEEGCVELEKIVRAATPGNRLWLNWRLHDAINTCRRQAWDEPKVPAILELLASTNRRQLRNADDLIALVQESLQRLDDELQRQVLSPIRDYWRNKGLGGKPETEVECTGRVAQWLRLDLAPGKGITVGREVNIQWNERTDIEVNAVAASGDNLQPLTVVIEGKGDWHVDIRTGAHTQLARRYLLRTGRTHGIYLVLWTRCAGYVKRRSKLKAKTIAEARDEVATIVQSPPAGVRIEPFVLDLTLPDTYLAKARKVSKSTV